MEVLKRLTKEIYKTFCDKFELAQNDLSSEYIDQLELGTQSDVLIDLQIPSYKRQKKIDKAAYDDWKSKVIASNQSNKIGWLASF